MSTHDAEIRWQRQADEPFTDRRYSRAHDWRFDGGSIVAASSSPHEVPIPYSRPEHVDPEEAFVAAISSCHMLTFLFLAAKRGYVVDTYADHAIGTMGPNAEGRRAVVRVTLHPSIAFSGAGVPTDADIAELHHESHEQCYIASSVRTTIDVEGTWRHVGGDAA